MFLAFVDCIVCADQQQQQRTNHTTSPVIVLSHCGIVTGWQQQSSLGQLQWLVLTPSIVFGGHLFSLLFHAHSPPDELRACKGHQYGARFREGH